MFLQTDSDKKQDINVSKRKKLALVTGYPAAEVYFDMSRFPKNYSHIRLFKEMLKRFRVRSLWDIMVLLQDLVQTAGVSILMNSPPSLA